jgi:NTE family protein
MRRCPPNDGGPKRRRVLLYSPDPIDADRATAALATVPGAELGAVDDDRVEVDFAGIPFELVWEHDHEGVWRRLRGEYLTMILIDLRSWDVALAQNSLRLLDDLDDAEDPEARYGFHRIIALVGGPEPELVDDQIVALGARGVAQVVRQRCGADRSPIEHADFYARILQRGAELLQTRPEPVRALCAAGGGITGIYYELGALKCLSDCLPDGSLNQFDMYFGISAGAVVTSLLASGYHVEECMAALVGHPGGRIGPLNLRMLHWAHVNIPDLRWRLNAAAQGAWRSFWKVMRLKAGPVTLLDDLIFDYTDLIGAPFHSDGFEQRLREILEKADAGNDFRRLRSRLFVGATDQDARQHVLFGADGLRDVPISKAVQASLSVNPAFSAVDIGGKYYEDGAVTRTSNFAEAIRRGANFVIVLDPFVPFVSREAGFAQRRGILYNIDQDLRTVSYTRFENARNWVLRKHPHVSAYTFLPANSQRRRLSVNPMDHRPALPIWQGAYLSTLQRVQHLCYRLRGDLAAQGLTLDTSRAEAVAERLGATQTPTFRDFFPDGEITIPQG